MGVIPPPHKVRRDTALDPVCMNLWGIPPAEWPVRVRVNLPYKTYLTPITFKSKEEISKNFLFDWKIPVESCKYQEKNFFEILLIIGKNPSCDPKLGVKHADFYGW